MSTDTFNIPKGFNKVLLVLAGMNVQMAIAGIGVSKCRGKIFNQEFMEQQFGEVHQKELGYKIGKGGYPDTGSGVYSQKLSYK